MAGSRGNRNPTVPRCRRRPEMQRGEGIHQNSSAHRCSSRLNVSVVGLRPAMRGHELFRLECPRSRGIAPPLQRRCIRHAVTRPGRTNELHFCPFDTGLCICTLLSSPFSFLRTKIRTGHSRGNRTLPRSIPPLPAECPLAVIDGICSSPFEPIQFSSPLSRGCDLHFSDPTSIKGGQEQSSHSPNLRTLAPSRADARGALP
jgi:hypothetical protein